MQWMETELGQLIFYTIYSMVMYSIVTNFFTNLNPKIKK